MSRRVLTCRDASVPPVTTVTTVLRCGPDDWALARAVRLASVRDSFGEDSEFFREQAGLEEAAWRRVLSEHARFAAYAGDRPAGAVCWRPQGPPEAGDGLLYGMWVHPDLRGTGLAARLVDAVVAVAREHRARRLSLKVEPGNGRARAFYAKTGFRELEPTDGDGGALVVMVRSLAPG